MSIKSVGRLGFSLLLLLCFSLLQPEAFAEAPLQSSHYTFEESVLGGGGLVQSSSPNYQSAGDSVGENAGGESASANYQVQAGNTTTKDPTLSFSINGTGASFGNLSAAATATATANFTVKNYVAYGYAVQVAGSTPTNNGHVIPGMATTDDSVAGTEQFGMNLKANTIPSSVGANPVYGPFSVGDVAGNYATPNKYRYVSGESIATGPKSSGETTYTISYILNVQSLTPGGVYAANQTLICTSTF